MPGQVRRAYRVTRLIAEGMFAHDDDLWRCEKNEGFKDVYERRWNAPRKSAHTSQTAPKP
jgi:hypothetical protein